MLIIGCATVQKQRQACLPPGPKPIQYTTSRPRLPPKPISHLLCTCLMHPHVQQHTTPAMVLKIPSKTRMLRPALLWSFERSETRRYACTYVRTQKSSHNRRLWCTYVHVRMYEVSEMPLHTAPPLTLRSCSERDKHVCYCQLFQTAQSPLFKEFKDYRALGGSDLHNTWKWQLCTEHMGQYIDH